VYDLSTVNASPANDPLVALPPRLRRRLRCAAPLRDSRTYREQRYAAGGNSAAGSFGALGRLKPEVLHGFVAERGVQSLLELGCGEGKQLRLAEHPRYRGFDVSPSAVARCRDSFAGDDTKWGDVLDDCRGECVDLALSPHASYQLVGNDPLEHHLRVPFGAGTRFVGIHSSNESLPLDEVAHIRHRRLTASIGANEPDWALPQHVPSTLDHEGHRGEGPRTELHCHGPAGDAS